MNKFLLTDDANAFQEFLKEISMWELLTCGRDALVLHDIPTIKMVSTELRRRTNQSAKVRDNLEIEDNYDRGFKIRTYLCDQCKGTFETECDATYDLGCQPGDDVASLCDDCFKELEKHIC